MANAAPATVTTSYSTGPGQALSSVKFTDVNELNFDFLHNVVRIVRSGAGSTLITAYDAATTLTWTISSGVTTVVMT